MKATLYIIIIPIFFNNFIIPQTIVDSVEVKAGWNLIGALESGGIAFPGSGVTLDLILTEPPGIISSPFWGFIPGGGYFQADSLKRGLGYWVNVSQDGILMYMSFTNCGTVDYGGKIYNTVQIGDQCWLKENLDVGTMINVIDTMKNNGLLEKYCYNNDPNNCNTYGGLYQWDEAMQYITTEGTQGICPPGWHIPTETEFQTLSTTVSGDGNSLKAIGQGSGAGAGTNTSGFSALLAGRGYDGDFYRLGVNTTFWSSTEFSSTDAYELYLIYNNTSIYLHNEFKTYGFSIRCLKD